MSCSPELLAVLTRIAEATEQQTEALRQVAQTNLMLLDELTSGPDPDNEDPEAKTRYLDGSPVRN